MTTLRRPLDDAKRPRADDEAARRSRPRRPTPLLKRARPDAVAAAPDAAQDAAPDAQDAATRQNLEARYVGLTFIDDDAAGEGAREIVRIEKTNNEWTAVAAQVANKENEQPYLVNEALDAMVDAYRCRRRRPHETCACPPPRGSHDRGPLGGPRRGDERSRGTSGGARSSARRTARATPSTMVMWY